MAAAVLVFHFGAGDVLEVVSGAIRRWFFAVFCVLFAITQVRVYLTRRRAEAHLARYVPSAPFAFFTALWSVLAVAGIVYGILELGLYWEIAGWITVALVVCVQLWVLGGIERRFRARAESDES